ncbi:MAG: hypothetical protein WA151_16100 [Desulfatirhabdiaceae bacterium]
MGYKNYALAGPAVNAWASIVGPVVANHEITLLDFHVVNKGYLSAEVRFAIFDAVPPTELATPENAAIEVLGTPGSTTYAYRVSALNSRGETLACSSVSITTGNATLNTSNYNRLTWNSVTGATKYWIHGRTGATMYLLAEQEGTTFDDKSMTALVSSSLVPSINSTAIRANVFTINVYPKYLNDPRQPYYYAVQKKLFLEAGQALKVCTTYKEVDIVVSGEDSIL